MVFDKVRVKRHFATWLNESMAALGVPERGRSAAVAKRYKVTIPAARKWLEGTGMPDMAQFVVIVADLGGPVQRVTGDDLIDAAMTFLPSNRVEERSTIAWGETRKSYVRLPLLAMEAGMGPGVEIDGQPEVVEYLDVARWWAEANLPRPHDRVKIITGRGNSNAPLINHGDIVFVDTSINYFDGEGIYVFNWNGSALIKRLMPNLRTNTLRIESLNPDARQFDEIRVDELDQMHVAGRVAAWYTLRRN